MTSQGIKYSAAEIVAATRTLLAEGHSDAMIVHVLGKMGVPDNTLLSEPSIIMNIVHAVKNAGPDDTSKDIFIAAKNRYLAQVGAK